MRYHKERGQLATCCHGGLIGFSPQSAPVSAATVIAHYNSVSLGSYYTSTISFDLLKGKMAFMNVLLGPGREIWLFQTLRKVVFASVLCVCNPSH